MRRDPLDRVRAGAWDGLRLAIGDLMAALEWAVIALALVFAAGLVGWLS